MGRRPHKEAKALFREMFFLYKEEKEICEATGVTSRIARRYIKEMLPEREAKEKELLSERIDPKMDQVAETIKVTIPSVKYLIEKFMEEVKTGDRKFTSSDIKNLSDIVTNLDKLLRLDAGKATDILEFVPPSTVQELKTAIELDKFMWGDIDGNDGDRPMEQIEGGK